MLPLNLHSGEPIKQHALLPHIQNDQTHNSVIVHRRDAEYAEKINIFLSAEGAQRKNLMHKNPYATI